MKSILSFIICISATICNGAVFETDGRLVSCCSCLLKALLPSSPYRSLLWALVPSYSFLWLLGLTSLWHSCSSKLWFCLIKRSTAATRVYTYLSRAVVRGLSSWLLLVAIEWVNTIQVFVWEVVIWLLLFSFPQTAPTDDVKNRQWVAQSSRALDRTCETETKKTLQRVPMWYRPNTLQRLS